MSKLYIPVVLGTARVGNHSQKVARFVAEEISKLDDLETEIVSPIDFETSKTIPGWTDDGTFSEWKGKASRADAFVIVTPEYNHHIPGELKILLDSAQEEYARKPVVTYGVSSGPFGGARVVENILPILVELRMVPVKDSLYFGKVAELFDSSGKILDSKYKERLTKSVNELVWFAKRLKK